MEEERKGIDFSEGAWRFRASGRAAGTVRILRDKKKQKNMYCMKIGTPGPVPPEIPMSMATQLAKRNEEKDALRELWVAAGRGEGHASVGERRASPGGEGHDATEAKANTLV